MPSAEHRVTHRNGRQVMVGGLRLRALGYTRGATVVVESLDAPQEPAWRFVVDNNEHSTLTCEATPPPAWLVLNARIRITVEPAGAHTSSRIAAATDAEPATRSSEDGVFTMGANEVFSGFDSAWSEGNAGAITSFVKSASTLSMVGPELATLREAPEILSRHRNRALYHLVAVDQPLIVPNESGSRPVDAVLGHEIGRHAGGVQRASRARADLFGREAPIWRFLESLGSSLDPTPARSAAGGVHSIEVYPAIALLGLFPVFRERRRLPKYNPDRDTFEISDWRALCLSLAGYLDALRIPDAPAWCAEVSRLTAPKKPDQDKLDSVICAVVALRWRGRERSAIVGDTTNGYVVLPVCEALEGVLASDAAAERVRFEVF